MREHSRDQGRLEDILKYAQNVEKIMDGISYEDFTKDIRIYYSVMKNVEVIGEAANMLTRHFRETHAELPWRQIVSMRNVLVTAMPKYLILTCGRQRQTTSIRCANK